MDNPIPPVSNALEEELLLELAHWIRTGEIQVERDNQPFFDRVDEAFPISFSRIDWSAVPGADVLPPPRTREQGNIDLGAHMPAIRAFLQKAENVLGIDAETMVLVLGDGQMDTVLRMRYDLLCEHLEEILGLPQHTYVIPEDASWCINYTFEDDLFFGVSPRVAGSRSPSPR